ncbi:MAG: class I SAM-dependent methyltransferase [Candidatus Harrisonbacteria bacterium]|nr:class I SAM-dependent methyltransferase [Candidatus Harrisonbacteria bacterium]
MIRKLLGRAYGKIHYFFYGPKRYRNIYRILQKTRPKRIMEIGVWTGERSIRMIETLKKYYAADAIDYYGFDLFEDLSDEQLVSEVSKKPPTKAQIQEKLEKTGANIHLFKGNTLETLPRETQSLPKMDFVFLDGGHSLETIENDWKYVKELMHEKTVVIFDDYWNRTNAGCKPLIDSLYKEGKYFVKVLQPQDTFQKEDGLLTINFALVRKQ